MCLKQFSYHLHLILFWNNIIFKSAYAHFVYLYFQMIWFNDLVSEQKSQALVVEIDMSLISD